MTSTSPTPADQPAPAGRITLRVGTAPERTLITAVLTDAFHNSSLGFWTDPNPLSRNTHLAEHFTAIVEQTLTHGVVHLAVARGHILAAALWTPAGTEPVRPPGPEYGLVPGPVQQLTLLTRLRATARPSTAHDDLIVVTARGTEAQQAALAAVLRPHLHHLDSTGTAAFTTTTDLDQYQVLTACGFCDHGTPIRVPDSTIVLRPMRRPPSAAGTPS